MENIDIVIDNEVLENIDIDKEILANIDIHKISNRLEFGISNSTTVSTYCTFLIIGQSASWKKVVVDRRRLQ